MLEFILYLGIRVKVEIVEICHEFVSFSYLTNFLVVSYFVLGAFLPCKSLVVSYFVFGVFLPCKSLVVSYFIICTHIYICVCVCVSE